MNKLRDSYSENHVCVVRIVRANQELNAESQSQKYTSSTNAIAYIVRVYSYHKVLPAPKLSFLGLDATKFLLLDKIHELRSYFQKTVTKAGI